MANGIELATAYINLAVDASRLAPDVRREFGAVEREADRTGRESGKKLGDGVKSGMGGTAKAIGGMFAGALAGIGVKNFLGDAFGEARESQKVGALTANVIKTTGGAAKVTAAQVGDLASAISKKNAVDDEAVQGGATAVRLRGCQFVGNLGDVTALIACTGQVVLGRLARAVTVCNCAGAIGRAADDFLHAHLYGDRGVLDRAAKVLPNLPEIETALSDLRRMADALGDLPLSFDLADLRGYHYHSGFW